MPAPRPPATYNPTTIALHWIGGFLILFLFYLGWMMTGDLVTGLTRGRYFEWHKVLGVTAFFLALGRIFWSTRRAKPAMMTKGLRPIEITLTQISLLALIILMALTPFSGWLLYSVSPYKAEILGLVRLPDLFFMPAYDDAPENLGHLLAEIHETLANILFATIVLHLALAVRNHFYLRNGVLVRIAPPFARPLLMKIREKSFWQDLHAKIKGLKKG